MSVEQKVKKMYTEYTYPKYDKYMDKFAPIPHQFTLSLFLEQINYYIYKGSKTNFDNYKVLVAGCGLGSDLINMGFFLNNYKNTNILGIDLSSTSLNICKERLQTYNLQNVNIELKELSLLDLEPSKYGLFDCIICIGVLHHLENPSKGLSKLNNVLKEDGFMNIMVYGKYGRTGVYQMQDLMKRINYKVKDFPNKIKNFKTIYKQLPKNNWFKRGEDLISDHKFSDEGIVDLLLHHQDRSYNIKELYEWINNSGLEIIEFAVDSRYKLKFKIDNVKYPDNLIDTYWINELFFGDIIKHNFYVSKNKNTIPKIENFDNILILVLLTKENLNLILKEFLTNKKEILYIQCNLNYIIEEKNIDKKKKFTWTNECYVNFNIKLNDIIYNILNNIDNKKTIKEIFEIVRTNLNIKLSDSELLNVFKPVYKQFELYDMILLKNNN